MRRADALICVAVASLVLGGCMRIYPDPELPDVVTEWTDFDCQPGTGNVEVALIGSTRTEVTVPCTDLGVTFADVAREQYRVEAFLHNRAGQQVSRSDSEIDLRNGVDETVYLYFGGFSNYRVSWQFSDDATCESLGAPFMFLQFAATDDSFMFEDITGCALAPHFGMLPDGTYTLTVFARTMTGTVAMSAESPELTVMAPDITDLGVITLSP